MHGMYKNECQFYKYINSIITYRGDSQTVQADKVSASAWMDRKAVMVMSTYCQPSDSGTVQRKQKDASSIVVPCPASIISYNRGVDRGDQLWGYYHCRSRSRKFYKYIFYFLLDVAITNTYILVKSSGQSFKDFKSFQLQLAKDLIGEYCSRRCRGRWGTVIHSLPFRHYPIRLDPNQCNPGVQGYSDRGVVWVYMDWGNPRIVSVTPVYGNTLKEEL